MSFSVSAPFSCGWAGRAPSGSFSCAASRSSQSPSDSCWSLAHRSLADFLALFLLCGIAFLFFLVPLLGVSAPTKIHPLRFHLGLALFATAVDFALTFVPSALAFTTRSARRALRIGFQMIRQTWPRCGLYVLCPPLALNFVNTIYPMHLTSVRLIVTAGATVLGLLAKGATAAFYLRERPTYGPDGAAHITAADEVPVLLVRD